MTGLFSRDKYTYLSTKASVQARCPADGETDHAGRAAVKIPDRHFLKYAGADSPRLMRKEQRLAQNAYVAGLTYEKPLNHPDRPENMDRKRLESVANGLPDTDNPSKITESTRAFKPPLPEGQEEGVNRDSPDNPSSILKAIGEFRPPDAPPPPLRELDDPSAITRALSEFKPPAEAAPPPPDADNPGKIPASLPEGPPPVQAAPPPLEMDTPGGILNGLSKSRPAEAALPGIEVDSPGSILSSMGKPGPPEAPMKPPEPTAIDIPTDMRAAPEASTGLIVSETA